MLYYMSYKGVYPTEYRSLRGKSKAVSFSRTSRRGTDLSYRQRSIIRKMIKTSQEPNHRDVDLAADVDVTTSGSIYDLAPMPQGDADGERLKDRVKPSSLEYRLQFVKKLGTSPRDIVRMVIIQWHPDGANDTLSAVSQVLESISPLSMTIGEDTERRKFTVLKDVTFPMAYDSSEVVGSSNKLIMGRCKVSRPIHYNEGLTTGLNKVHVLFCSTSATANDIEIAEGHFRLHYRDV